MKIKELSITNCLSFGSKGFNPDNSILLNDFNLFIGANNAGKSNVLKLAELLRSILSSVGSSDNSLQNFHVGVQGQAINWVFTQQPKEEMTFSFSLEISEQDESVLGILPYKHDGDRNPIAFMFARKNGWPKIFKVTSVIVFRDEQLNATITKVEIPNDHQAYSKEPFLFDRETRTILALKPEFRDELVWKFIRYSPTQENEWRSDFSKIGIATRELLMRLSERIFYDGLVRIQAIREIRPAGDEIPEVLSRLKEGSANEYARFSSVQKFLHQLVFDTSQETFELRFPGTTGQKSVSIALGNLVLPLSQYGSSIEQLLVLATRIVQNGSKVILTEEPEAHFHPDLQRKFMRFLLDNQEIFRHQYLIATHSNVFIDEFVKMGGNVFYVYMEQDEQSTARNSQVQPLAKDNLTDLLKQLGARPSDVLLANGVLVVEGTTDEDIYTDWAKKLGKPFGMASLLVIDVAGFGNIPKYLTSPVIQQTCFKTFGLCDKNAEKELRRKLKGIVPDENIIVLDKGDLEDYYPRELVLEFIKDQYKIRSKKEDEIPDVIKVGETVEKLDKLLGKDKWKKNLSRRILDEMRPDQIEKEIHVKLTQIFDSVC